MLVDPQDSCGQTGTPVSFSVDGPQFFTSSGDRPSSCLCAGHLKYCFTMHYNALQ